MAKEDHNWVGIGIAAALILIGIAAVVGAYRYGFAGIGQFASSIFWWAIGILFFFFIIRWCLFGGVFCPRPFYSGKYRHIRNDEAYYILKERYAKGEISKKEYEEKMKGINEY
jgi:uncharacterized membrane protein